MPGNYTANHSVACGVEEHSRVYSKRGNGRSRNARNRIMTNKSCPAANVPFALHEDAFPSFAEAFGDAAYADSWQHSSFSENAVVYSGIVVNDSLAMTGSSELPCRFQNTIGNAANLLSQPEHCNDVIDELERGSATEKHMVVLWLLLDIRQLSISKAGCRVVQKAFEVAGNSDRDLMIAQIQDRIVELYESPHGNYVLSKAIEVMPAAKNGFIISALRGRCAAVSKHRFGCRVLCRLIEHCEEAQIEDLLDEVMTVAPTLSQHQYGNFIVQSMFEHMGPARRQVLLQQLLPGFAAMCTHRTGSLVAQRILNYCDVAGQHAAIQALLESYAVVDVACSHYGSYVVEEIAGMQASHSGLVQMIWSILADNLHYLFSSEHAERVTQAFGLSPVSPCAAMA